LSTHTRTILFVHPSDELYGSDRCLLEIVRGLPATDRAIVVLPRDVAYQGTLTEALRACSAEVRHIDMLVLRRGLLRPARFPLLLARLVGGVWSLTRLILAERVDLVHSNTVAVVCGALGARVTRRPHLWHVHEFLGDEPKPFRAALRVVLALSPGLIIANSVAVARSLVGDSRRLRRRTSVIYNGVFVPIQARDPAVLRADGPPRIGVLGRLAPRKGIGAALHATALLADAGAPIELRIGGGPPPDQPWWLDSYRRLANELCIAERVHFAGTVDDVDAFLHDLDILLVPSQRPEPFGLVVIEGMAAGLPVVVTRNGGGSDELITHGKNGLYCAMEPEAIAAALQLLLADTALRARMAAAAPETVARRFSRSAYQTAFAQAYARLLNHR
jgi:hypothetical protein